ncbi:MAG TPA: universal stress protein [Mycobacteriales bacterium]|nr:universal stress protein [Mycobacteriales bacterium]
MKVEGRRMYHRIVVGTDGSATADRAVDAAGGIARLTGGSVHIVTAYRPAARASAVVAGEALTPTWFGEEERLAAEQMVEQAAVRLKERGVPASPVARLGDPADVLLAAAEEFDADLLVVGNRGTTGVRRYLLGSVADRVVHHASCTVHIAHTC